MMSYKVAPDVAWVVDEATGVVYGQRLADGTVVPLAEAGAGGGGGYLGDVANTAALTGLSSAVIGDTANVGAAEASYVLYELKTSPYSVAANWQALQGVQTGGTVYTVELVEGKLPRRAWCYVPTGNQVTVTVGGATLPVLFECDEDTPHLIEIYDIPGVAAPTSITFQRTSGSDATGWFSVEG